MKYNVSKDHPNLGAEIWKPIVGYEGLYEVSGHGRVRSIRRPRAKGGVRKPSVRHNGYLYLPLQNGRSKRQVLVHRLVAEAFLGPRPTPRHVVTHLNGDKQDNRVKNLAWTNRAVHEEAMKSAVELRKQRMPIRKIAECVGVPYGTLAGLLKGA